VSTVVRITSICPFPKMLPEHALGHASIALTLDTYSHVIPGMDGGTGGAIDEALG
jgi:integrase